MIGDRELPGVGEEDGDYFARLEAGGDKTARQRFDQSGVFGVGEAASAGGIDERSFGGVALAALENDIVDEAAGRVGKELGAQHRGRLYTRAEVRGWR